MWNILEYEHCVRMGYFSSSHPAKFITGHLWRFPCPHYKWRNRGKDTSSELPLRPNSVTSKRKQGEKEAWFVTFASFHGVNTPPWTASGYPQGVITQRVGDEICTISPQEPVWASPHALLNGSHKHIVKHYFKQRLANCGHGANPTSICLHK